MAAKPTDVMAAKPTDMMAAKPTDVMAAKPTDVMVAKPTEAMMADAPLWFKSELTDVNTGLKFRLADYKGKVVLVEMMAVWCSTCMQQQRQVLALKNTLGKRDDFVSVALDIDANETPELLKKHATQNSFNWVYAISPVEVSREIAKHYGDQFLNPPSAPMLIVSREGQVHKLPFGLKSAADLKAALDPVLQK
jgi:cytochrome oxidase Cu insertion factor (SCO1/SenC/PrrC family)